MAAPILFHRVFNNIIVMNCRSTVFICSNCYTLSKHLNLNTTSVSIQSRSTGSNSASKKKISIPKFLDFLQLEINGGTGGQGLSKFGGFGGCGGNVVIAASNKVKSLRELAIKYPKQRCKAGPGDDSSKFHLLGTKGTDLKLEVPIGVLVHLGKGKIVDLNKDKESVVVSRGGAGGKPNTNFLGQRGESNLVGLELKLLADVGLVGFPNAGKSTFLRAVSRAKPKVASYPFTTISPQLGMVEFKDGRKISIADLPGLIEGAHQNYGKGIKFLRHAERTKLLLFVLDLNPFQLSLKYPERTAFETLLLLMQELNLYGHGMVDKPAILAINKTDTDPSGVKVNKLLEQIENLPDSMKTLDESFHPEKLVNFESIITMSAEKKEKTSSVTDCIRSVMDDYADRRLREELEVHKLLQQSQEQLQTTLV